MLDSTLLSDEFNSFPNYVQFLGNANWNSGGWLRLTTDGISDQTGTAILRSPGRPITTFFADFRLSMWGSGTGADGMGFAYAPPGLYHGSGSTGLWFAVDTFDNGGGGGFSIIYNGQERASIVLPAAQMRGINQRVQLTVNPSGSGSVTYNYGESSRTLSFTLPGWTSSAQPQSNWSFLASAWCGGLNDHQELENMIIEDRTDPPSITANVQQDSGNGFANVGNGSQISDATTPRFSWSVTDPENDLSSVSAKVEFAPAPGNTNPARTITTSPSSPYSPSKADGPGTYTLTVTATDRSALTSTAVRSYTLFDDDAVSAPQLVLNGSSGTESHGLTQAFSWTATDASGIAGTNVQVFKDGALIHSQVYAPPPGSPSLTGSTPFTGSFNFDSYGLGVFSISATATDNDNDPGRVNDSLTSAPKTQSVTVTNTAPVAFAGLNKTTREGQSVSFDGRGSTDVDNDVLTYSWNFGDGSTGSGAQPTHTYADDGAYHVALTVSDGYGGASGHSLDVTSLNVAPQITSVSNSGPGMPGDTIAVTVGASDVSGDPMTYEFDFNGDGVYETSGASNSASYAFASSNVYAVNVRVTDGDGGSATGATSVVIGAPPAVSPVVTLDSTAQTVNEDAGAISVSASLDQPSTSNVFVPIILSGSAAPLADYEVPHAYLQFPAGAIHADLAINLIDDASDEFDETITVSLGTPIYATLGSIAAHTITVLDQDAPPLVSFTQASQTADEGSSSVLLRARVSQVSGKDVAIPLAFSGTASGADYALSQGTNLLIPAGSESGSLVVSLVDDNHAELNETIVAAMQTPTNATLSTQPGASTTHVVTIPENDAPSVSFDTVYQLKDEGTVATLTVQLSHAPAAPLDIPFSFTGSTATGTDYTATASPLHFGTTDTAKTITLNLTNDGLAELRDTLQVTLNPSSTVLRGATTRSVVEINDKNTPSVYIVSGTPIVKETETGSLTVGIADNQLAAYDIVIPFSAVGGKALADDFDLQTPSFITIPAGQHTATAPNALLHVNDNLFEYNNDVILGISAPPGSPGSPPSFQLKSGEAVTHTMTLANDDFPVTFSSTSTKELGRESEVIPGFPFVYFTRADYMRVPFTVNVSERATQAIDVYLTFSGAAARDTHASAALFDDVSTSPANDYFLADRDLTPIETDLALLSYTQIGISPPQVNNNATVKLTIPVGQKSATIWVYLKPDLRVENNESINISVTNVVNAPIGTRFASITIRDDDVETVSMLLNPDPVADQYLPSYVSESAESASVWFALNSPSDNDVTVHVTARHTQDWWYSTNEPAETPLEFHVVIPHDDIDQQVEIELPWTDDDYTDTSEKWEVTIDRVENAKIAGSTTRYVFITDNDMPNGEQVSAMRRDAIDFLSAKDLRNSIIPGSGDWAANAAYRWFGEDGYISGATAFFDGNRNGLLDFLDLNQDGVQDPNEPSEVSDTTAFDGSFVLEIPGGFDRNVDGVISDSEGQIVVAGGIDISRNAPQPFSLVAPIGSSVVTPLTTLAATLVNQQGLTPAQAKARVASALALPNDVDFTQTDPIAAGADGSLSAARLFAAGAKIQDTLAQAAGVLSNVANAPPLAFATDLLWQDLAAKIVASNAQLDLSVPAVIESVLEGAATRAGLSLDASLRTAAAEVIAAGNQHLDDLPAVASLDYLEAVTQTQVVAQGAAAAGLAEVARGLQNPAAVQQQFTGAALETIIEGATAATITPPRLDIEAAAVAESDSGPAVLRFTVSMSGTPAAPVSVQYASSSGLDVVLGVDYTRTAGTLTWAVGDNSPRMIEVPILDDALFENDEQFLMFLGDAQGAVVTTNVVYGTIINDEAFAYTVPPDGVASDLLVELNGSQTSIYRNGSLVLSRNLLGPMPIQLVGQEHAANSLTVRWNGPSDILRRGLEFVGRGADNALILDDGFADTVIHTRTNPLEGEFQIDDNFVSYRGVASVADAFAPRIQGAPFSVDEGANIQVSAAGADPEHSYDFTWRAARGASQVSGLGPTFEFVAEQNGIYLLSLDSASNGLGVARVMQGIEVQNISPDFDAGPTAILPPPQAGMLSRIGLTFTDPGADVWTGTVNYGDSATNFPLVIDQQNKRFDLSHTYAANGVYTVSITIDDGDGGSHTDSFQVEVILNTTPDAKDDASATDEGTVKLINVLADNGAGPDSDSENNILPALTALVAAPAKGVLTNNNDGTFTFDPHGDFESLAVGETATVSFVYRIQDSFGETDTATATITVAGLNDGPTANPDATGTDEDHAVTVTVVGNDTDPDASDLLTVSAANINSGLGSVSFSGGKITYDPGASYNDLAVGENATVVIGYAIGDGHGGSASSALTITVLGVNDGPSAANLGFHVIEDGLVSGNLLAGAADPDASDHPSIAKLTGAGGIALAGQSVATQYGVVTLHADGTFTYTPGAGAEADSDSFAYTLDDGHGGAATATVTIAIDHYAGVVLAGGVLRVGGGSANDVVTVSGGNLLVNGVARSLASVTEVRIWGRGANDTVDLSGLAIPAFVHGGMGNDVLTGGSANDVIFGAEGDDTVTGAAGNDLLVGGQGKDRIVGAAGHDVLVSGDVARWLGLEALREISRSWAASQTVSADAADDAIDETVGNGAGDSLTGSSGADLFIISSGDTITDFQFGKPNTNKDGDVVIKDGVQVQ